MARFCPVVPGRLWQVRDLLPREQVQAIVTTDWMSLPWANSPQQQAWLRREIIWSAPRAQELSRLFDPVIDEINSVAGTEFTKHAGTFWVDLPGFQVPMHTDGHLANSLQMYWIMPDAESGTGFYHFRSPNSLRYQFASVVNTGYLLLNHPEPDGSQPLFWHGMFRPVPPGHIRVSSYWQFS